VAGREEEER
jgi:hypothetical protein